MTEAADEKTPAETATKRKAVKKKKATKRTKKASAAGRLRVKQVRSTIKRQRTLGRTLTAIGIKHHQDEVVVNDTPAMRGMLLKVRAFVQVTPEES